MQEASIHGGLVLNTTIWPIHQHTLQREVLTRVCASTDDDAAARVLSPAQQQALAYVALALVHTVLAAATTLAPGWSLQHIFGFPLTTATSLQLINAGAYLWLLATCLVCLKVLEL